jgi:hypothetical protein
MITMVLIAAAALMLTMFLLRTTSARSRRDQPDGIRWRGIDWSRKPDEDEKDEE